MSKTKSKAKNTQVKLTPKQASIASVSLLRGLDNAIEKSRRGTAELETLKSRVGTLSAGLSNLASIPARPAQAAKAAAKPKAPRPEKKAAAKPSQAKPATAKQKAAPKAAPKPAKATPAAKEVPAKAESEKPAPAAHNPPVSGRPSARIATKEMLAANGGSMKSADLRKAVCAKYGQYSNQTFYEVFKHDPEISLVNNVVSLVRPSKEDSDMDLVRRVEADRSTASVV